MIEAVIVTVIQRGTEYTWARVEILDGGQMLSNNPISMAHVHMELFLVLLMLGCRAGGIPFRMEDLCSLASCVSSLVSSSDVSGVDFV